MKRVLAGALLTGLVLFALCSTALAAPCPKCGREVPAGDAFCGQCGAKIEATVVCPKCAKVAEPGAKFCGECGASLQGAATEGFKCPQCKKDAAPNLQFCDGCGAKLTGLLPAGPDDPKPGTVQTITLPGGATMDLVWVPAGRFMMGSNNGYAVERPVHRVELRGFWIGKTEVTVAQWRSVMGSVPDSDQTNGSQPVVDVGWHDCQEFCRRAGLVLPTEARWEYAARGPEGLEYPWGREFRASSCQSDADMHGFPGTAPAGSFPSGASWCGALDMAGNVWEWCRDRYDEYYYSSALAGAVDPECVKAGQEADGARVLRGGAWGNQPQHCRSAYRGWAQPSRRLDLGFRASKNP